MERLWVPSLQSYLWLQVEISWSRPQCLRFRNEANAYDGCQSTEEFRAMPLFLHHLPIYITRRYKKFWEEPQASQTDTVSYNVDFLWSRSKASNIFFPPKSRLGIFPVFVPTFQNSGNSSVWCDGALRKIRAKPAEKIGAVCPRIWESLVLPVNRGISRWPYHPIIVLQDTASGISEIARNPKPRLNLTEFITFEFQMFNTKFVSCII